MPLLKHLRANVVAYLALFAALGGSAYAAGTLGKGQVKSRNIAANAVTSPKVKNHSLRAIDFATGQLPHGATGATGAAGPAGAQGPAGRSALTALQSGETESGEFSADNATTASSQTILGSVTFPIPLAAGLDAAHVIYLPAGTSSVTHCPGVGQAESGFLCLYESTHQGAAYTSASISKDSAVNGADAVGFVLFAISTAADNNFAVGRWTVTG